MPKEIYEIYYRNVKNIHPGMRAVAELLKRKKSAKILDFCCGNGRNCIYFAQRHFNVYGFDWSKEGIQKAKHEIKQRGLKAHFIVWDMFKPLPYDNDYFDAVIAVRAMFHGTHSQLDKVLKEVARITKSGGYLYWHIPTYKNYLEIKKAKETVLKKIEPHTYLATAGQYKGNVRHYFSKKESEKFLKPYYIIEKIRSDPMTFSILAQRR